MDKNVIQEKIFEVNGFRVMLDFDLAELYGGADQGIEPGGEKEFGAVSKGLYVSAHQRTVAKLEVTICDLKLGWSQISSFAFTEHGVTMLASVLRSEQAISMNILIVRAFIALREIGMHYKELADKIRELEKRYNKQFVDIQQALEILLVEG